MNCPICGLVFAPEETVGFRAHRRVHGALVMLEALAAAEAPKPATRTAETPADKPDPAQVTEDPSHSIPPVK